MRVSIYQIIKRTGLTDGDGRELIIVFDTKLTFQQAEEVRLKNPGTTVIKTTVVK